MLILKCIINAKLANLTQTCGWGKAVSSLCRMPTALLVVVFHKICTTFPINPVLLCLKWRDSVHHLPLWQTESFNSALELILSCFMEWENLMLSEKKKKGILGSSFCLVTSNLASHSVNCYVEACKDIMMILLFKELMFPSQSSLMTQ